MKTGNQGFRKTTFKKGNRPFPWWEDPEKRKAASVRMRAMTWKGNKIGIAGIHDWLKREFDKANKCENGKCLKRSVVYEYALLKGKEYERKRENFWMLCKSCHKKYDVYFREKDFSCSGVKI